MFVVGRSWLGGRFRNNGLHHCTLRRVSAPLACREALGKAENVATWEPPLGAAPFNTQQFVCSDGHLLRVVRPHLIRSARADSGQHCRS